MLRLQSAEVEAAAKAAAERANRDGQDNAAEIEKLGNEVDALKENLADARNAVDMHAAKGERLVGELSALRGEKEGLEEELEQAQKDRQEQRQLREREGESRAREGGRSRKTT